MDKQMQTEKELVMDQQPQRENGPIANEQTQKENSPAKNQQRTQLFAKLGFAGCFLVLIGLFVAVMVFLMICILIVNYLFINA